MVRKLLVWQRAGVRAAGVRCKQVCVLLVRWRAKRSGACTAHWGLGKEASKASEAKVRKLLVWRRAKRPSCRRVLQASVHAARQTASQALWRVHWGLGEEASEANGEGGERSE